MDRPPQRQSAARSETRSFIQLTVEARDPAGTIQFAPNINDQAYFAAVNQQQQAQLQNGGFAAGAGYHYDHGYNGHN